MQNVFARTRLARSSRARLLAAVMLIAGVLVAGCGGSSHGRAVVNAGGATRSASRTGRSDSTKLAAYGSGPLAFAKCMRANGVSDFPDPSPGGQFAIPAGLNPAAPAVRAAQAKCQKLMGGAPPAPGSTTHPSPQTLAKLDRIARCVRAHGVPQFPDPRTSIPSRPTGIQEITDFDGAILLFPTTLNLQAPAYKHALTACGAPPLGLHH